MNNQIDRNLIDECIEVLVKCKTHDTELSLEILYLISKLEEQKHTYDLDIGAWNDIKESITRSNWIPPEYYMNDWVSDIKRFVEFGKYPELIISSMYFHRSFLHEVIEFLGNQYHRYTTERHPNGECRIYLIDGRVINEGDLIIKKHTGEIIINE